MRDFFYSQKGFSAAEMLLIAGLSGLASVAGYGVIMLGTELEKKTSVQALLDTEFARGLQLANNPARLLPYVNAASLGDCLRSEKGAGCETFGAWQNFPEVTGPGGAEFQTKLNLNGVCTEADSSLCLVTRRMRFRWLCEATSCRALEVEVAVAGKAESRAKARSSRISLDRKLLSERGQLDFRCEESGESVGGVDYAHLTDECVTIIPLNCNPPLDYFTIGGAASDCRPPQNSSCGSGFTSIGLDEGADNCAGEGGGEGPKAVSPKAGDTCDPAKLAAAKASMVQSQDITANELASACIDATNPTMADSLPTTPAKLIRFMNTCGNRYCQSKGYYAGRGVEYNDPTVRVECRMATPPARTPEACKEAIAEAAPVSSLNASVNAIAEGCRDAANPALVDNLPSDDTRASRFVSTCGNRYCVAKGFSSGSVTEYIGDSATVVCYDGLADPGDGSSDPTKAITAKKNAVRDGCIDSANPTPEMNEPSVNLFRFTNTCGNRYCQSLGYKSGSVIEIPPGDDIRLNCY